MTFAAVLPVLVAALALSGAASARTSEGEPVESRYLAAEDEDFAAHLAGMGEALVARLNRPADPPEGDA